MCGPQLKAVSTLHVLSTNVPSGSRAASSMSRFQQPHAEGTLAPYGALAPISKPKPFSAVVYLCGNVGLKSGAKAPHGA